MTEPSSVPTSSPTAPATPDRPISAPLQLVRAACHLIVVVAVFVWGFLDWPAPWLWLTGFGFGLLSVLIWALFLSPRAMLHTDRFGQSLIELLFIASGVGAMLALGVHWIVAILFGLIAAVAGYLVISKK